jgi:calcineurin-like phosphoesterase family protein
MKLNEQILIYADPHFGHSNIIKYENRPFKDKYDMDEKLISNYNSYVHDSTKVLILGDFSFYPKEKTVEIIKTLKGYKMLIMGNHDLRKSEKYYLECGFQAVSRYPILFKGVLFSHAPVNVPETIINIHGHMHSKSLKTPNHICASVERTKYKPIELTTLEMEKKYELKDYNFKIFRDYKEKWYKCTD